VPCVVFELVDDVGTGEDHAEAPAAEICDAARHNDGMQLVRPAAEYLPSYRAALERSAIVLQDATDQIGPDGLSRHRTGIDRVIPDV